jgi:hypothetical protein
MQSQTSIDSVSKTGEKKKMAASARDIVLLGVCFIMAAILIPVSMGQLIGTTTTTWNSAVTLLWQLLLPILMIIGIAILFIPRLRGKD